MDVDEVKTCLRALLSSTAFSFDTVTLLSDFKKMTGYNLPLFGYSNPLDFLRTLDDTVKLMGDPLNPDIALVKSEKSSHIISLVDKQKNPSLRRKCSHLMMKQKRLILPSDKDMPRSTKQFSNFSINFNTNKTWQSSNEKKNSETNRDIKKGETSIPDKDLKDYSDCFVNEGIKNKLRKLIKTYPEGLWCCELAELFLNEFHFPLNYQEFGYTSLIEMLSSLPDVFRCVRPGNEDWILFDASSPPSVEERKMTDMEAMLKLNKEIMTNLEIVLKDLENHLELDEFLKLYENTFERGLDFRSLGHKDARSLLKTYDGSLLSLLDVDGKTFVVPAESKAHEEAIPPITVENDLFLEIFPHYVVGPNESLVELDLACHVAVGQVVLVCVAEVWSPSRFYVQLKKFKVRLNQFMDDLQQFYNIYLNKYKMPDSTIRPNQICVGPYTVDPDFPEEWYRAKIIKVLNEKTVLLDFVDFGTVARVKKTHLRFLHRQFQDFPVQAFLAQLAGVGPPTGEKKWPTATSGKFLKMLQVPYLKAKIVDVDFKKPVMSVVLIDTFQTPPVDINKKLIGEKLASEKEPSGEENVEAGGKQEKNKLSSETKITTTNEFSDIADLGDSTSLNLKMKSLDIEDGTKELERRVKEVADEFGEVFDLEKPDEVVESLEPKESAKPKETATVDVLDEKKEERKSNSIDCLRGALKQVSVSADDVFLQVEETKKLINLLSIELLTRNPNIRQVGMMDPALALKIAIEMAEVYVYAGYKVVENVPTTTTATPSEGENSLVPSTADAVTENRKPNEAKTKKTLTNVIHKEERIKENEREKCVKEIKLGQKSLHLVTVDCKLYFSVNEVIKSFEIIINRDIADKVLKKRRITIDYKILTKDIGNETWSEISRIEKSVSGTEKKITKIYLVLASQLLEFLNGLGYVTQSIESELKKFLKQNRKSPK